MVAEGHVTSDGHANGPRERKVVDAFVDLADTMVEDYDVLDFLHRLLDHALPLLPVDDGGVLLHHDGELRVVAASSEDAATVELFEVQHAEGPCMDAYRRGEAVAVERLEDNAERWPVFVPKALEHGWRSAYAVPMRLRADHIGALNLFARDHAVLDGRDRRLIRGLADVATIGILRERQTADRDETVRQLQVALESRVVIEQAKGRIVERSGCDMSEAFDRLRTHARQHRRRLGDVALAVIEDRLAIDDLGRRATA